jgi:hypothetical protein
MFRITPEHEARELINLIALLDRCLHLPDAGENERTQWREELSDAYRRLAELCPPGSDGHALLRQAGAAGVGPPVISPA